MRFTVDPGNVKLPAKPIRGDIVSFSYEQYARNMVPVSPKVFRIRTDVTWQDVVRNETGEQLLLNGIRNRRRGSRETTNNMLFPSYLFTLAY